MTDRPRVGVVMGGRSSEREISLETGRNVFNSLDRSRFEPVPLYMDGYRDALDALIGRRYEVCTIQVMAPDELKPELTGDLRLVDSETGAEVDVSLSETLMRYYRRNVEAFAEGLHSYCVSRGILHLRITSDIDLEDFVLQRLRQAGLVA